MWLTSRNHRISNKHIHASIALSPSVLSFFIESVFLLIPMTQPEKMMRRYSLHVKAAHHSLNVLNSKIKSGCVETNCSTEKNLETPNQSFTLADFSTALIFIDSSDTDTLIKCYFGGRIFSVKLKFKTGSRMKRSYSPRGTPLRSSLAPRSEVQGVSCRLDK